MFWLIRVGIIPHAKIFWYLGNKKYRNQSNFVFTDISREFLLINQFGSTINYQIFRIITVL